MKNEKLKQRLKKKFADLVYRSVYADSHLDAAIALQIKALRTQRGMSQQELAAKAGLKQPQISAMEQTCFDSWTLKTLRKVASAFELPLLVKFASWGEMLEDACSLSPSCLERPSFAEDDAFRVKSDPGSNEMVGQVVYFEDFRPMSGGYEPVRDVEEKQIATESVSRLSNYG